MRSAWACGWVWAVCGLSGCAQGPGEIEAARVPHDFGIGVTVHAPEDRDAARALRPARYLLEPDGALRAAVGAGADERTFPPVTRVVDADGRARVWALFVNAGLVGGTHERVGYGGRFEPSGDDPEAMVYASWDGRRRAWRVVLDPGRDAGAGTGPEALIDAMAELAWVAD